MLAKVFNKASKGQKLMSGTKQLNENNYASKKEHLFMDAKSNLWIIPIDDKY